MARFRREHRIHDLREALRRSAERLRERLRERIRKRNDDSIKRTRESTENKSRSAKEFNLLARLRQRFHIKIEDPWFKLETLRNYMADYIVSQNIFTYDHVRNTILDALNRIREPDLRNLYLYNKLIARYQNPPCGSVKFYIKITYTTLNILRTIRDKFTLYVRNWINNSKLRDRLLQAVAFVLQLLLRSRTKPEDEDYNSELLANPESTLSENDQVTVSRSDTTQTERRYSLGFLLRHPSLIARALAMKLGLAEHSHDAHHCSVYAFLPERSKMKYYVNLPYQQYYDFIVYERRRKMRGVK